VGSIRSGAVGYAFGGDGAAILALPFGGCGARHDPSPSPVFPGNLQASIFMTSKEKNPEHY
jgi:hypothetical protein